MEKNIIRTKCGTRLCLPKFAGNCETISWHITKPSVEMQQVLSVLRMEANDEIRSLYHQSQQIAKPKAAFKVCKPTKHNDTFSLNGIPFPEPFVKKMLSECETVIPYVATCGKELDTWASNLTDMFAQFVADTLKQLYLNVMKEKLFNEMHERFFDIKRNISTLNPGSLPEWPLSGQRPVFDLLGRVEIDIGVSLSNSLLMSPNKSVSGIMFQAEEDFHNCQLCPREDCVSRRVAYDLQIRKC